MKIARRGARHQPRPQLRHPADHHRRRRRRARRRDLNGRELAVASLPARPRRPAADRPRRAPRSRTPGSTSTAARTGGAARSRWPPSPPSTSRCGTSRPRPPACRCTSCSAARSRDAAAWPTATPRGRDLPELFDSVREHLDAGLPGDPHPDRHPRPRPGLRRGRATPAAAGDALRLRAGPARPPRPVEEDWDTRAYLRHVPDRLRGGAQRVRPRAAAAARRATTG